MDSRRSRAQNDHPLVVTAKAFKIFLKGVHIRSKGHDPVGVKRLLDVFHFLAAHVSQTKQNSVISHIIEFTLLS